MKRKLVDCKISKAYVYKDTRGCLDYTCETCPEDPPVVKKTDKDKSIYRKKPYTPELNKPCKDEASVELKAILEKEHTPIAQYLVDLANKGANIAMIARTLTEIPRKRKDKTGTYDMTMDLSNEAKSYFKEEKAINNAFDWLTERLLKPVFPDTYQGQNINIEITKMQSELKKYKPIINMYLNLRLYEICFEKIEKSLFRGVDSETPKTATLEAIRQILPPDILRDMFLKKVKPAKQSTHDLWNEAKLLIANELEGIGCYSIKQSQKITADLLNLFQPDIYTDKEPDLIKSACKYHKKKVKE